jgi:hypothetical protein
MDKYFLVNVQQDASPDWPPDWRAVVRAATAEEAAQVALLAWEGECVEGERDASGNPASEK